MSIGGRTAWYCPSCGRALNTGGACQSCGSSAVPEGAVVMDDKGGLGGLIKRWVGKLGGRGS